MSELAFSFSNKIYDVLYTSKDYTEECNYLERVFSRFETGKTSRIVDFGCGTGGHSIPLAERGYRVHGVDASEEMIEIALSKTQENSRKSPRFSVGDICTIDLEESSDALVMMFAVVGYQTENVKLQNLFRNARKHLRKEGLLVFDCWYGPAVLSQKPSVRLKSIHLDENTELLRYAEPELDAFNSIVKVKYTILKIGDDRIVEKAEEVHFMRYLFPQEIQLLLENASFECLDISPFMDLEKRPTEDDWNISVVAKAV